MQRSDGAPDSSANAFLGWHNTPHDQVFGFEEQTSPAGLNPYDDDGSAFNISWGKDTSQFFATTPMAAQAAAAPAPGVAGDTPRATRGQGHAAAAGGGVLLDMPAPTPRTSSFVAAASRVDDAIKLSLSPDYDDWQTRNWQDSPSFVPPPHAAGHKLCLASLAYYTSPAYLVNMDPAQQAYIYDFEAGNTCLGPTHMMRVEKLIVTAKFPSILLVGKGEEGLTKEIVYTHMKSGGYNHVFDFEDKAQKEEKEEASEDDAAPAKAKGVKDNLIFFHIKLPPNMQNLMPPLPPPAPTKKGKAPAAGSKKKIKRGDRCRCSISRCAQTQALQLVLYNVPYSCGFVTHCMGQFQVFLTDRFYGGQTSPAYEFKNFQFSPIQFTTLKSIDYLRARYIVEKVFKAESILEDTADKDKEEDKKYKKLTFKLDVPHAPGSAPGALKKTRELTFNLFLDQPNCSKILVYESGLVFETFGLRMMKLVELLVCASSEKWRVPEDFAQYCESYHTMQAGSSGGEARRVRAKTRE